ncbi:glycosyltransferase family 48, partial [Fusarium albosuccineum]
IIIIIISSKGGKGGKKHDYNQDEGSDEYDGNNSDYSKRGNYNSDDGNDNSDGDYNQYPGNYDEGRNYGHDGYRGAAHSVKYIEVDIDCKYGKKCSEWCCCA